MPELHLVIPTHTGRFLRRALLGAACQDRPADTITVTCDNDGDEVPAVLEPAAAELGIGITLVRRAHCGTERLSQVRNNAIRSLVERGAAPDSRLLFLDGDTVPAPDVVAKHLRFGRRRDLVVAFRLNLTSAQTEAFDDRAVLEQRRPVEPTPDQVRDLVRRHNRYVRQKFWRVLHMAKPHKPKPLGGHHSVRLDICRAVNGYDEEYHTYGTEDDDFGRRLYAAGGTSVVAVRHIMVYHQHHASRGGGDWHDRDNARLFRQRRPTRCRHGLDSPMPQEPIEVLVFEPRAAQTALTTRQGPAGGRDSTRKACDSDNRDL